MKYFALCLLYTGAQGTLLLTLRKVMRGRKIRPTGYKGKRRRMDQRQGTVTHRHPASSASLDGLPAARKEAPWKEGMMEGSTYAVRE